LRIEARVRSKDEARRCQREARELIASLARVWPYVAGGPLFPARLTMQVRKSPEGWRTNSQKILSVLPSTGLSLSMKIGPVVGAYSITMPYMPVRNALSAVRAYLTANETTRVLLELNSEAMALPGSQSGLFLFAKGLDLARLVLPGRDDKARENALAERAQRSLRQSLHWLYGIANRRLEIRHVVGNKNLLPRLSPSERADYLHDADLVIRGVVERELGIPVAIVNRATEKVP